MKLRYIYTLKLLLIIGWVSFSLTGISQNLVPNGDFEEYQKCPDDFTQFTGYINDWFSYFSTPDFLHKCGHYVNIEARNNSRGLVTLRTYRKRANDYPREYIHNRLKRPLKTGERVYISYWITQRPYGYLIDQWSFYFSEQPSEVYPDSGKLYIELPAQVNWKGGPIRDTNNYVQLQGCYIAQGGEQYFCFGNFAPPSEVQVDSLTPDGYRPKGNYVGIDDMQMISEDDIHYDSIEICVSDTFHFIDYYDLGLFATYEGERIDSGFSQQFPGRYNIEIRLPDCGVIDTMPIIFKPCSDCYPEFKDVTLCLLDTFNIREYVHPWINLSIKVEEEEYRDVFNPGKAGTYKATLIDKNKCDSAGSFTISFTDCASCSPGFESISICPDEVGNLLIDKPYYIDNLDELDCPGTYQLPVYHKDCPNPVDTQQIYLTDYDECRDFKLLDTFCIGDKPFLSDISPLIYDFSTPLPDTFSSSGNYNFWIVDRACNEQVANGLLVVFDCGDCPVYIPNVFTPNGDDINDVFSVSTNCEISEFRGYIFDRFGNLLKESRNAHEVWKGEDHNPGVYTYLIEMRVPGKDGLIDKKFHGSITLIR